MLIRERGKGDVVKGLRVYIKRMERRYECPSDAMVSAVKCHLVKETAEIGKWMTRYRILNGLESGRKDRPLHGDMTGINTKDI